MAASELSEEMSVAEQALDMLAGEVAGHAKVQWDPGNSKDWDAEKPTQQCFMRIKRDIMSIYSEPPPGMCVVPEKDDWTTIHALITGPYDTPYEGGFFYFLIRCPPDYPIRPPRVKLVTTGDGQVRFNPNLYKNGKVCLSILGTWSGPAWSPAQSLASVLISIQSLMNEKPYHNEPGFEHERTAGDAKRYNEIIRHETLRVAVCDMLEGRCKCPNELMEVMRKSYPAYYSYYVSSCESNLNHNGQTMQDPFGERRGKFDYQNIIKRLEAIKAKLNCDDEDLSDMESSSDSENDANVKDSTTNPVSSGATATNTITRTMETEDSAPGVVAMATNATAMETDANSMELESGMNSHNAPEPMS